jgi:hypothetical protein
VPAKELAVDVSTVGSSADNYLTFGVWGLLAAAFVAIGFRLMAARERLTPTTDPSSTSSANPQTSTTQGPAAVEVDGRALRDRVASTFDFEMYREQ